MGAGKPGGMQHSVLHKAFEQLHETFYGLKNPGETLVWRVFVGGASQETVSMRVSGKEHLWVRELQVWAGEAIPDH